MIQFSFSNNNKRNLSSFFFENFSSGNIYHTISTSLTSLYYFFEELPFTQYFQQDYLKFFLHIFLTYNYRVSLASASFLHLSLYPSFLPFFFFSSFISFFLSLLSSFTPYLFATVSVPSIGTIDVSIPVGWCSLAFATVSACSKSAGVVCPAVLRLPRPFPPYSSISSSLFQLPAPSRLKINGSSALSVEHARIRDNESRRA